MPYYNSCPYCGSNLDPGETCDCQREKRKAEEEYKQRGGDRCGNYAKTASRAIPRR